MPVGTYGTVKAMAPNELAEIGAQIVLGNTFHLWLRPGIDVIAAHGGLHRFMGWDRPILTDSGRLPGVQPRAAAQDQRGRRGVRLAGRRRPAVPDARNLDATSSARSTPTSRWCSTNARPSRRAATKRRRRCSCRCAGRARSKAAHAGSANALFGIVQGGMYEDLRDESLAGAHRDRLRRLRDRRPVGRRAEGRRCAASRPTSRRGCRPTGRAT